MENQRSFRLIKMHEASNEVQQKCQEVLRLKWGENYEET